MCEKEQDKQRNHVSMNQDRLRQRFPYERKNLNQVPSNMCHQCQRNKGRVVRCRKCTKELYLHDWVKIEEPRIKNEKFSGCCTVCCDRCTCISCTRIEHPKVKEKIDFKPSDDQKVQNAIRNLHVLVPIVKRLSEEHIKEKAIESKIQGSSLLEVQLKNADCIRYMNMQCACCKTSVFDLHRSCSSCQYDICLQCCSELRDGNLQGNKEEVIIEYKDPGPDYLHGKKARTRYVEKAAADPAPKEKQTHDWKPLYDGRIPCPPKSMGGCGHGIMELTNLKPLDSNLKLLEKAQNLLKMHKLEDMSEMPVKWCSCSNFVRESDGGDQQLRRAASRENSNDNYLYCPRAIDIQAGDLKNFEWHWSKGEPVIVSNVLETTLGLNAEPMVMSSAFHQIYSYKRDRGSSTKFIEYREIYKTKIKAPKHDINLRMAPRRCLDWCEVDITLQKFFAWYIDDIFDAEWWPTLEAKKDWPLLNLFEERLPLLGVEFITSLPFKEYTHPREGYLNLAVKLPKECSKPDMAPKIYIAYAIAQELGRGDSVIKLHCEKSDMVNVLVHIPTVTPDRKRINQLKKQEQKELDIDNTEDATSEQVGLKKQKGKPVGNNDNSDICVDGSDLGEEGALWDIFRREDTPKLEEYLNKHFREFRDVFGRQLQQIVHPIHDQTFYLTMEHKRKLKEEFGIEPWTFVQKLGDAVFIPAGCAHQVKNLKSCIKVAVNFVSPENIDECIQLTEEFRLLPQNHRAKEDTLEVKKIALHALESAVEDLENFVPKNSQYLESSQARPHLQYNENRRGFLTFNQVPITKNLQTHQNIEQGATSEARLQINHDTTRSCANYFAGNEESGGIIKRLRTSEEGDNLIHSSQKAPK